MYVSYVSVDVYVCVYVYVVFSRPFNLKKNIVYAQSRCTNARAIWGLALDGPKVYILVASGYVQFTDEIRSNTVEIRSKYGRNTVEIRSNTGEIQSNTVKYGEIR